MLRWFAAICTVCVRGLHKIFEPMALKALIQP